ncbi:hypothetical protein [Paludibacterium purpuratum]|uniref:Uncharacterized protein n=1 Tax=Paludibacterium purpuratum TaxID=1144873 RepID=A0A4R7BAY0_9NEIS|nr:hypothetical protein [Paludibacterium purpuratum]TDR82021.1 hypothetical protein DFP86_102133 [Paludibacterium purpuratum]
MAISGSELGIIARLLHSLRAERPRRPRVVCLGYPDILADAGTFANLGLGISWDKVAKREDSQAAWQAHGLDMADTGMCEAASLFEQMNSELWIVSDQSLACPHIVHDMNYPIAGALRRQLGEVDMIIDPGMLSAQFNIAQGFQNIDLLLSRQGIVYHQSTVVAPNQTFWGISPTAFYDFYEPRGYILGIPCLWATQRDARGFEPVLQEANPFETYPQYPPNLFGSFIFRKGVRAMHDLRFPIQRCYSGRPTNIQLADFIADAIPPSHVIRLPRN